MKIARMIVSIGLALFAAIESPVHAQTVRYGQSDDTDNMLFGRVSTSEHMHWGTFVKGSLPPLKNPPMVLEPEDPQGRSDAPSTPVFRNRKGGSPLRPKMDKLKSCPGGLGPKVINGRRSRCSPWRSSTLPGVRNTSEKETTQAPGAWGESGGGLPEAAGGGGGGELGQFPAWHEMSPPVSGQFIPGFGGSHPGFGTMPNSQMGGWGPGLPAQQGLLPARQNVLPPSAFSHWPVAFMPAYNAPIGTAPLISKYPPMPVSHASVGDGQRTVTGVCGQLLNSSLSRH